MGKGDVFEFLRQQRAAEKSISGLGKDTGEKKEKAPFLEFLSDDKDPTIVGLNDEDEVKKITPYKTDIEYLDDQVGFC
jgi:hypothetical protein